MTPTTVLASDGFKLSYDIEIQGWIAYINPDACGYNDTQALAVAEAMLAAQRDEFDARLPEGCTWYPRTSEIVGPIDADNLPDIGETMAEAAEAVIARNDDIEAQALADL